MMRILIYGAGVIGCLYGVLLSEANFEITVYARGQRLADFKQNGLLYFKNKQVHKANVKIIDKVEKEDVYDFVFLTVKENQVHTALNELKKNDSTTIVTMVNTLEKYEKWEAICGKGRILPAFPGAGGSFVGSMLSASLTPKIVQPTTFGEIDGHPSARLSKLAALFKTAKIPYQIVNDMHAWQVCHLAMVVPLADAYYAFDDPLNVGRNRLVMRKTAQRLKENFCILKQKGIPLVPKKMHLFQWLPISILSFGLGLVFQSNFGNVFMYRHAMNAADEMKSLHQQFYAYIKVKVE